MKSLVSKLVLSLAFLSLSAASLADCPQLVVPAYFSPDFSWLQMVFSGPAVGFVVMNPDDGPGDGQRLSYSLAVKAAHFAGVKVLGYVATHYGARSFAAMKADIDNYYSWYGVDGIFLDEAATAPSQLEYYQTANDYIHAKKIHALTVINPGTYPDESYMSAADVIGTFEGTYANYEKMRTPEWTKRYAAKHFYQIIDEVNEPDIDKVLRIAQQNNVGYLYYTNYGGSNPYVQLPPYWAQQGQTCVEP